MKSSSDKFRQWVELNLVTKPIFESTKWDKIWATSTLLLFYLLSDEPKAFMIVAAIFIVGSTTANSVNQRAISKLEEKIQTLENSKKTTD